MLTSQRRTRVQRVLILAGLCLALLYVAAYRPLSQSAVELDRPLVALWHDLLSISVQTNATTEDYLPRISEALEEAQRSLTAVNSLKDTLMARIALDPVNLERMNEPFQLIDFQNERQIEVEEMSRLAGQQKVTLGPAVMTGFPEYAVDRRHPTLLWSQLAFVHHVLTGAIRAKVATVTSLRLPPIVYHYTGTNAQDWVAEIPVQLELAGTAATVLPFLESLPLRTDEIQARGLPEALPNKPALFLQRILVRKENRDQPDAVRLELIVSGFILPGQPLPE